MRTFPIIRYDLSLIIHILKMSHKETKPSFENPLFNFDSIDTLMKGGNKRIMIE